MNLFFGNTDIFANFAPQNQYTPPKPPNSWQHYASRL